MGRLVGSLGPLFGRGGAEGGCLDESFQSLDIVWWGRDGGLSSLGQGRKEKSCFIHYLLNSGLCKEHKGNLETIKEESLRHGSPIPSDAQAGWI